jgi:peroxiredoxin Q/BCP
LQVDFGYRFSEENPMSRYILLAAAVLVIGLLVGLRSAKAVETPAVGTIAPDFTLNSQEGTPVSLKDFRGKWVVLYFYPKDFTSGCTVEAHNFQRDFAQYEKRGVAIVGVSVDSADSHKQFCTKEGLNFKLLADTDKKVSEEYGSLTNLGLVKFAARHTFIIDPEGKIARVYTSVDPSKHSTEVLSALDDLQKSSPAGTH